MPAPIEQFMAEKAELVIVLALLAIFLYVLYPEYHWIVYSIIGLGILWWGFQTFRKEKPSSFKDLLSKKKERAK